LRLLLFQLAGKARSSAKQTSFFKRRKAPKAARYTTSERAYWEELPELLLGANHFLLFPNLSTSRHKALLPHRTYRPHRHQSTGRVPLASSPTAAPRSLTGRHPRVPNSSLGRSSTAPPCLVQPRSWESAGRRRRR
jgi:hypothetical protein